MNTFAHLKLVVVAAAEEQKARRALAASASPDGAAVYPTVYPSRQSGAFGEYFYFISY
jgi:hypothetical protein